MGLGESNRAREERPHIIDLTELLCLLLWYKIRSCRYQFPSSQVAGKKQRNRRHQLGFLQRCSISCPCRAQNSLPKYIIHASLSVISSRLPISHPARMNSLLLLFRISDSAKRLKAVAAYIHIMVESACRLRVDPNQSPIRQF